MRTLVSALCISITTVCLAQQPQISHFFKSSTNSGFRLDHTGKYLFYTNSTHKNTIYRITIENKSLDSITTSFAIKTWELLENGVFILENKQDEAVLYHYDKKSLKQDVNKNIADIKEISLVSKQRITCPGLMFRVKTSTDLGLFRLEERYLNLTKVYADHPHSNLFFDLDLNLVAAYSPTEDEGNIFYLYNNEQKGWDTILKHEWSMDQLILRGLSRIITVSNDGKRVYYTSNRNSDKSRLYEFDKESGETKELASSTITDLIPFGSSVNFNHEVTSAVGLFGKTIRVSTDKQTEKDFLYLKKELGCEIGFLMPSRNDSAWLVRSFCGGPSSVYYYDRYTQKIELLTTSHPELSNIEIAPRKAHSILTSDSLLIPFHVYLPKGSDKNNDGIPDKPLPTVMYMHGGPWAGITHWNGYYHWRCFQYLASRGIAVVNCDFRGSIGMGKKFVEASKKQWGQSMSEDNVAIKRWLVKEGISDSSKVALWGWSYGGYATLINLALYPDDFKCGISMYAPTNLLSFGKTAYVDNEFWHEWVGNPYKEGDVQMLITNSPTEHVQKIKAPVLLTTGSKDRRVPQSQMDDIAELLFKQGNEVTYFYYPEEVHDYRNDDNWISFWSVAEKFLEKHIGSKITANEEPYIKNFEKVYGDESYFEN